MLASSALFYGRLIVRVKISPYANTVVFCFYRRMVLLGGEGANVEMELPPGVALYTDDGACIGNCSLSDTV